MTAPLTRSITPRMWVVFVTLTILVVAIPVVRKEGVIGQIAYYAVAASSFVFITTWLLGFASRIADARTSVRRNEHENSA